MTTIVLAWLVLSVFTAPLSVVLVRSGQLADRLPGSTPTAPGTTAASLVPSPRRPSGGMAEFTG